MKKIIKWFISCFRNTKNKESVYTINGVVPRPMRSVKYGDQIRVIKSLETLPVKGSFPVGKELKYTVYKMARDYFPEYKIRVVNFGSTLRVFRAA
jgi:hypothetical protein